MTWKISSLGGRRGFSAAVLDPRSPREGDEDHGQLVLVYTTVSVEVALLQQDPLGLFNVLSIVILGNKNHHHRVVKLPNVPHGGGFKAICICNITQGSEKNCQNRFPPECSPTIEIETCLP